MKINHTLFCLPPYISTTWGTVMALHMKGDLLYVALADGETIQIPGLKQDIIDLIFENHAAFLEEEETIDKAAEQIVQAQNSQNNPFMQIIHGSEMGNSPFRFGMGGLDGMANAMQHNPAQAHAPDLPQEILEKIASIAKAVSPEDPDMLPQAEPHCNCVYCQIARTIHNVVEEEEECTTQPFYQHEVKDEDLEFQQWEITQKEDKLFNVTNKLDRDEKYDVFLGHPVGCTCGTGNCEHIVAVLKS